MYLSTKTGLLLIILLLGAAAPLMAFQSRDNHDDIGWYESFFRDKKPRPVDQVLAETSHRLELASARGDMPLVVRSLNEIGLIHLTRTNVYDQAIDVLIRALAIEDSLEFKQDEVFTYLVMAKVFEEIGNFHKSAELVEDAMLLNEQLGNVRILVLLLNELGNVHAAMGHIDAAFENYEQVLEYKDRVQEPSIEAEALFNLAHLYQIQGKYQAALKDHKQALAIYRSISDKENEARSLNDIGELYTLMKNDDKTLANYVAALEIYQFLEDKKGLSESYNNIGAWYYQHKNIERAIDNLELALSAAREMQNQDQIQKSYEYLSYCYTVEGNYKKTLYYKDELLKMNDFIQSEKNTQQALDAQTRYVIGHKELQIEKLVADGKLRAKELDDQKKFRNILMVLVSLTLIIVVLVFYLYNIKRRSNQILQAANEKVQQQNIELQELNATKDKFFSIISHDLKGPLNSLTSFSGLLINHTNSLSKEDIQMLAKDLDKSLKNLFALLENLLEWSRSQTGNIEFKPENFDLIKLLEENVELLSAQAHTKSITLSLSSSGSIPVTVHRHSINTVVRNLLSNSIKFTPAGGVITLAAKRVNHEVVTSIIDTGVGMSPEIIEKLFRIDTKHSTKGTANEKGTGLGLILCKEFVEKNGGRIWVESEIGKGSAFYFSLPVT